MLWSNLSEPKPMIDYCWWWIINEYRQILIGSSQHLPTGSLYESVFFCYMNNSVVNLSVLTVCGGQCCVLIFILPSLHSNVVHYLHLLSTQISAGECCSKSSTPWCTYRKLWSQQPPRLVTRQKHPALNGEQKTSTTLLFNNYSPTILQYGSAAGAVVSVAI